MINDVCGMFILFLVLIRGMEFNGVFFYEDNNLQEVHDICGNSILRKYVIIPLFSQY